MVGIHFFQRPNPSTISIMSESTKRTVAYMVSFSLCRLSSIHPTFDIIIEDTNVEQLGILASTKHILKYILIICYKF